VGFGARNFSRPSRVASTEAARRRERSAEAIREIKMRVTRFSALNSWRNLATQLTRHACRHQDAAEAFMLAGGATVCLRARSVSRQPCHPSPRGGFQFVLLAPTERRVSPNTVSSSCRFVSHLTGAGGTTLAADSM